MRIGYAVLFEISWPTTSITYIQTIEYLQKMAPYRHPFWLTIKLAGTKKNKTTLLKSKPPIEQPNKSAPFPLQLD